MHVSTRRCTGWGEEQARARPFPGSDESGGHGEVTGCWALESEGRVVFRGGRVGMELFSAAASLAVSDVCEVYAFSSVECVMSRKINAHR